MKSTFTIAWIIISTVMIFIIILREPNVESVGTIIQESQYKEIESEKRVDKIIISLFILFIILTVYLFIENQ